jgi:hypothetical protein
MYVLTKSLKTLKLKKGKIPDLEKSFDLGNSRNGSIPLI